MVYDEKLADRVRRIVKGRRGITEKAMFGGVSFLLNGKMFCGVLKDDFVARINPEASDAFIKQSHIRAMDFTGRPMKGFLYVGQGALKSDAHLKNWVDRTLSFVTTLPTLKKK